jgi:hypothetical protein
MVSSLALLGAYRFTTSAPLPFEPSKSAGTSMSICHSHNLVQAPSASLPFGIRVKLRSTDPFRNLVGADWNKEHWFATSAERDQALKEMSTRYPYFRPGDAPALDFELINK